MNPADVKTVGDGDHAVVCLSGWFGCSSTWGPWAEAITTDEFTWYFPDYRGYGDRQNVNGEFTIDEIAHDLDALLQSIPTSRTSLLGHSMGSVFMQKLLQNTSTAIDSLIGLSPVPSSGFPLPPDQRRLFEAAAHDVQARRSIIDITTGSRLPARWLDETAAGTKHQSLDEAVGSYFRAWADCDFLDELGTRDTPILVTTGAMDPAVTPDVVTPPYGRTFPNIDLVTFHDAGHYPMFEVPLALASTVEKFLRSHRS